MVTKDARNPVYRKVAAKPINILKNDDDDDDDNNNNNNNSYI